MPAVQPDPTHGRPRIAEIPTTRGALHVHVERDSGCLYIWAMGPRGGSHGPLILRPARALDVVTDWLADRERLIDGGDGWLHFTHNGTSLGHRVRMVHSATGRTLWHARMDDAAWDELISVVDAWHEGVDGPLRMGSGLR